MQKTEQKIIIPSAFTEPVAEAQIFYGHYYERFENDSPHASRTSLKERLLPLARRLSSQDIILDLGAGRQIFESELQEQDFSPRIITVDVANIESHQLLSNKQHVQASGTALPFKDGSIALAISNMAFDFMPRSALDELMRVLKPGATILMNLHHPSLIPQELESNIRRVQRKIHFKQKYNKQKGLEEDHLELAAHMHKYYLKTNGKLYKTPEDVSDTFKTSGFKVYDVKLGEDNEGQKWWEVTMKKPAKETIIWQQQNAA